MPSAASLLCCRKLSRVLARLSPVYHTHAKFLVNMTDNRTDLTVFREKSDVFFILECYLAFSNTVFHTPRLIASS